VNEEHLAVSAELLEHLGDAPHCFIILEHHLVNESKSHIPQMVDGSLHSEHQPKETPKHFRVEGGTELLGEEIAEVFDVHEPRLDHGQLLESIIRDRIILFVDHMLLDIFEGAKAPNSPAVIPFHTLDARFGCGSPLSGEERFPSRSSQETTCTYQG
jgi:hypothetical protein